MGITALPTTSAVASPRADAAQAAAAGGALPSDALPSGFAALLSQLAGNQGFAPPSLATPAETTAAEDLPALTTTDPTQPLPPELAALLGQFAGNQAPAAMTADPKGSKEAGTDDPASGDLASLIQNAMPYLPPAVANTPNTAVDRSIGKDTDDQGRLSSGQLADPATDNPLAGLNLAGLANGQTSGQSPEANTASPTTAVNAGLPGSAGELRAETNSSANIAAETPPPAAGNTFGAALASAQATQQGNKEQAISANLPTPLHDQQWGQNFSEKIVWLAKSDHQIAQININPPQLGPVQINLSINGDQASAVFTSAHAEVRQAIADAMPQLREMLSSAGISLGQANVGAQLPQQQRDTPPQFANGTRFSDEPAILPGDSNTATPSAQSIQRGRGLVDLFA